MALVLATLKTNLENMFNNAEQAGTTFDAYQIQAEFMANAIHSYYVLAQDSLGNTIISVDVATFTSTLVSVFQEGLSHNSASWMSQNIASAIYAYFLSTVFTPTNAPGIGISNKMSTVVYGMDGDFMSMFGDINQGRNYQADKMATIIHNYALLCQTLLTYMIPPNILTMLLPIL